jgi:tRNA(fMet)-specific endonuclease VapC
MKVLDTTFLIDLLDGKKETLNIIESEGPLFTTQINMYELIRGLYLEKTSDEDIKKSMHLFESITVLPFDNFAALKSAEIFARLIKKGLRIPNGDCMVAGTTISKGFATVVTRNVKDFKRIKELKVESY